MEGGGLRKQAAPVCMEWPWEETDVYNLCIPNVPEALALQGSSLFSGVGTGQLPRELEMTGKGTAMSALTGGGLKHRNHHFRLSLVHWCAFPVSRARASARSWLSLCQR